MIVNRNNLARWTVLAALALVGCGGDTRQPAQSPVPAPDAKAAQLAKLEQQNAEAARRIAELEAETERRQAEAKAQQQAAADAERQRQERLEAERKAEDAETERLAAAERKRRREIFIGSLPQKHWDRWTQLSEQQKAGTIAPQDAQWLKALETAAERIVLGNPLDEQDLLALRSVDLPYWGTRDGSVLHAKLALLESKPQSRALVRLVLDEYAPKLGLDREQTASLGAWIASFQGHDLVEQHSLVRLLANKLATDRPLTNRVLERAREIPALDAPVARYEQALADPARAAVIYGNAAADAAGALKEAQDRVDAAQKALDEDLPKLRALEAKIEPLANAARSTSRTRETLERLKKEAAELIVRIEENRATIDSLQLQLQSFKDSVAEYQEKMKAVGGH
jgi:chromosome segregation ATPase